MFLEKIFSEKCIKVNKLAFSCKLSTINCDQVISYKWLTTNYYSVFNESRLFYTSRKINYYIYNLFRLQVYC